MKPSLLSVPRVSFGCGKLSELPEELKWFGVSRLGIISEPGMIQAGLVGRLTTVLEEKEIDYEIFSGVIPEPPISVVDEGVEFVATKKCNGILGFGGGSSMDSAKAIAVVYDNGGLGKEYFGVGKVPSRSIPLFQVPSTAGTGSEVTMGAIFADPEEKRKNGIVSPHMFADSVIIDPELTFSMPKFVTACTGLDALLHAIESYLSVNSNELTDLFALKSIELTTGFMLNAYKEGDKASREAMSLGSYFSGVSMANAGGAAIHAFGYPVSGCYHEAHGLVNAIFLLPILKRNMPLCPDKTKKMAEVMGIPVSGIEFDQIASSVLRRCEVLLKELGLDKGLEDIGVSDHELKNFAANVLKETRLLQNNPFVFNLEEALKVYEEAF